MEEKTKKINTVLIFGAGASFDCYPQKDGLPMSKDIYNTSNRYVSNAMQRHDFIRSELSFVETKLTESGNNVEEMLDKLKDDKKHSAFWIRSLFYLRDLMLEGEELANRPDNNYTKLLSFLQNDERVEVSDIISFNYDNILDFNFRTRYGITTVKGHLNTQPRLIKPHGSSDWYSDIKFPPDWIDANDTDSRRIESKIAKNIPFLRLDDINLDQAEVGTNQSIKRSTENRTGELPRPVMLLPIMTKSLPSGEWNIPICAAMEDAIYKADHIILVGYKGADKDFIDLISKRVDGSHKPLVISTVGTGSAVSIRDDLVNLGLGGLKGFVFKTGFSRFVKVLCDFEYGDRFIRIVGNGYICVQDYTERYDEFREEKIYSAVGDTGILLDANFERYVSGEVAIV